MNHIPEEFEKLQKLLKFKRYEVPPPGYFNNFPTNVARGIERRGTQGTFALLPWLRKLFGLLETNPFAAGVFGASVCGLLISGIAWSQSHSSADYSSGSNLSMNVADNSSISTSALAKAYTVDSLAPSFAALGNGGSGSLFTGLGSISVEPVSFTVSH